MEQQLLTPFEVLLYSPAGLGYPTAQFCDLIPQIEEAFFEECLGAEFRGWMVESIRELPENVEAWQGNVVYQTGDFAIWQGCIFESLEDDNEDEPSEVSWQAFERFENAAAQQLWAKYLRRVLAFKVYRASLTYTVYRGGNGGLLVNTGDGTGFRSLNKQELADLKNQLEADIELTNRNMMNWLLKNYKELEIPYSSPIGCDENGCIPKRRNVRRWNFRN